MRSEANSRPLLLSPQSPLVGSSPSFQLLYFVRPSVSTFSRNQVKPEVSNSATQNTSTYLCDTQRYPSDDTRIFPTPIAFTLGFTRMHLYNDISSLPFCTFIRFTMEDLFEPFWGTCGYVNSQSMLSIEYLLTSAFRTLSSDLTSSSSTPRTPFISQNGW